MASTAKLQKKEVKYLNRDFTAFRTNLIEFAKIYFYGRHKQNIHRTPQKLALHFFVR